MTRAAVLAGLGAWAPPLEVGNDEIGAHFGRDSDWIYSRTGILSRRRATPGTSTSTMAVAAGERALRSAGVSTVDHVVLATTTPDQTMPATAQVVAAALDLPSAAFDLNAACSGFLCGLAVTSGLISAGVAGSVLLIGAETMSSIVDVQDAATGPLFGDGAGAVVLRAGTADEPGALSAFDLHGAGEHAQLINVPLGGHMSMEGREVFLSAVSKMASSSMAAVTAGGHVVADVDRVVGHQANIRILRAVAGQLDLPEDRLVTNIARFGNTSAASIPLAMAEGVTTGALRPEELVLVTAFGAGFTWGATTLRWPKLDVEEVK